MIFGADFAADGRLATTALDGSLRLYQIGATGVKRTGRMRIQSGTPYSVAFAPDGKMLAIGLQNAPMVDLVDTQSLASVANGALRQQWQPGRVSWSADGRRCTPPARSAAATAFRWWRLATPAAHPDASCTVSAISSPRSAHAAATACWWQTAEPSWAMLKQSWRAAVRTKRQSGDFRDAGDSFRVAGDASNCRRRCCANGGQVVSFDLKQGDLRSGGSKDPTAAQQRASGQKVEGWKTASSRH